MVCLLNYKGMKLQKHRIILSQHINYLYKRLAHLNFDVFTTVMFIFFYEISNYVEV